MSKAGIYRPKETCVEDGHRQARNQRPGRLRSGLEKSFDAVVVLGHGGGSGRTAQAWFCARLNALKPA